MRGFAALRRVQRESAISTRSWGRMQSRRLSSASQPPWLASLLASQAPPPVLYAWTGANLSPPSAWPRPPPSGNEANDLEHRIFILGLGNLGRLYATFLAKAAQPPPITLVVHRRELLAQWQQSQGIELVRPRDGIREKNRNFDVEWWTEEPPAHGPAHEVATRPAVASHDRSTAVGSTGYAGKIRNLVIATKATASLPEADRLRRYLDGSSVVGFVQNGMSKLWPPHGRLYVSSRFADQGLEHPSFLALVTTHGVFPAPGGSPFASVHASPADVAAGSVLLGQGCEAARQVDYLLSKLISAPHLDARVVPRADLWTLQLEKLVVNSIINPLTAILRCKNGALFPDDAEADEDAAALARVMDRLLEEASTVLRALVDHDSSDNILAAPVDELPSSAPSAADREMELATTRTRLRERFSYSDLSAMLQRVGAKVRDNTSSMLQDVQAGKPTEVRDFNGWVADTATFLGLDDATSGSAHRVMVDLVESGEQLDAKQLARRVLSPAS